MKMRVAASALCLLVVNAAACASKAPPPAATLAAETSPAAPAPPPTAPTAAARPPAALRSASEILGDAIRAIGTPEAWNAHKTMRVTLEMTFQGLGITGTGERIVTATDKSLVVTNIPGVGVIREGSNGSTFWSADPIHGVRLLEGNEEEQARADSVWNPELRLNQLYRKIEAKNETDPAGKPLECLVLIPRSAPPTTNCYDAATHLQVSQKGTRATPQGDTPFSSTLSDWRSVGGLKMAFGVLTQAGPITFKGTVKAVSFDEPVADKMFEPPEPETPPAAPAPAARSKRKVKAGAKAKP
ncbi:MAG TPA: hypothetical protein VFH73_27355 [Polyangia bacterium]|jgi:hypothetical protein|nr:hypothetical protein [Polyangia bacterium]